MATHIRERQVQAHPLASERAVVAWEGEGMGQDSKVYLFHAHVYWKAPKDFALAEAFRQRIIKQYEQDERVTAFGPCRGPVGPHTYPMFQVTFNREVFTDFLVWLGFNRPDQIHILIHFVTPHMVEDHTSRALWVGPALPDAINTSFLDRIYEMRMKGMADRDVLLNFA